MNFDQYCEKYKLHLATPHELGYPVLFDGAWHRVGRYMEPGEKVWAVLRESRGDMVVEAAIEETVDYWIAPEHAHLEGVIYHTKSVHLLNNEIRVPTDKKTENGWTVYRSGTEEDLVGATRGVQELWLDEPMGGHGISLGDEVYLSLEEALSVCRPTAARHLKRRLKRYRNKYRALVDSTWRMNGYPGPKWPALPLKMVYVRKA